MMELLKLSSFKALRRPKLRLFANSCRLFLAFISADLYCHLLPFISAVLVCFACFSVVYLSLSLSRLAASPFSVCFVRCLIFFLLRAFLSVQACCILFISVHFGSSYMFSLVPRASVTVVQRNGKTKTSGRLRLSSTFHWPITERAQLRRKLINSNICSPISNSKPHAI